MWRACSKALDHIDEIVEIIKKSPDSNTARTRLMETFAFSDKQAQAILDMRLARLTGLERERLLGGVSRSWKRRSPICKAC